MASCGSKKTPDRFNPDSVLTEKQMEAVLFDVYMTESMIRQKEREGKDLIYFSNHYYDLMFQKHNIDTLMLIRSYEYYAEKPEVLKEINQKVLDSLIILETTFVGDTNP